MLAVFIVLVLLIILILVSFYVCLCKKYFSRRRDQMNDERTGQYPANQLHDGTITAKVHPYLSFWIQISSLAIQRRKLLATRRKPPAHVSSRECSICSRNLSWHATPRPREPRAARRLRFREKGEFHFSVQTFYAFGKRGKLDFYAFPPQIVFLDFSSAQAFNRSDRSGNQRRRIASFFSQ